MSWRAAQCKNCGQALKVDDNLKKATCPYCGTPYTDQEDHYHVEHLHANNVVMNDEHSSDNLIKNGVQYLKFRDWKTAEGYFVEVTRIKPSDYRCWWGLARTYTEDFSKKMDEMEHQEKFVYLDKVLDCYSKTIQTASPEKRHKIEATCLSYMNEVQETLIRIVKNDKSERNDLLVQQKSLQSKHRAAETQAKACSDKNNQYYRGAHVIMEKTRLFRRIIGFGGLILFILGCFDSADTMPVKAQLGLAGIVGSIILSIVFGVVKSVFTKLYIFYGRRNTALTDKERRLRYDLDQINERIEALSKEISCLNRRGKAYYRFQ